MHTEILKRSSDGEATTSSQGLVLIVDDDRINRLVLRKPLEMQGFEVVEAEDAQQAARQVAARVPDVILLDVMMPRLNGYEVCRLFKSNGTTAAVPIIMVTVLGEREQRLQGIEAGATDFLTKPVDARELTLRVRNAVQTKRLYDQVKAERQRSDELLLHLLPRPIAERMKHGERDIAELHSDVTILVANLVGLTELTSHVAPEQVVYLLTEIFSTFDELVEARGLEKIKTFGHHYLVAGGVPQGRADHAQAIADLALQMREEARQFNAQYDTFVKLRIGIASGPVVAGVIGRRKIAYDLWGDTVNAAMRLEAAALPEGTLVAALTAQMIEGAFTLNSPGPGSLGGLTDGEARFLLRRAGN